MSGRELAAQILGDDPQDLERLSRTQMVLPAAKQLERTAERVFGRVDAIAHVFGKRAIQPRARQQIVAMDLAGALQDDFGVFDDDVGRRHPLRDFTALREHLEQQREIGLEVRMADDRKRSVVQPARLGQRAQRRRPRAGATQRPHGLSREVFRRLAGLEPRAPRLLVVICEHGQEFFVGARGALEPFRKKQVLGASLRLRQRRIGDFADQGVRECELTLAGQRRCRPFLDNLAFLQAFERGQHLRRVKPAHVDDGAGPEDPANQGRILRDPLLERGQQVEPRRERAVDRVGYPNLERIGRPLPALLRAHEPSAIDQHPQDLLNEERIPLGARQNRGAHVVRHGLALQEILDEALAVRAGERRQRDGGVVADASAPARVAVQ